jgi:hypothetical protein
MIPEEIYEKAIGHLFQDGNEHFLFFLCSTIGEGDDFVFNVDAVEIVDDRDTCLSSYFALEIKLPRLIEVMNLANRNGLALVEAHNHPDYFGGGFSVTDENGFNEFVPYVQDVLKKPYGATVWDRKGGFCGVFWPLGSSKHLTIDKFEVIEPSNRTNYQGREKLER